ncbi:MAG: OmcA/MtrC family decaheme c-type cytochrome [Deltaproteobacteria bacterium]|nr:MAG: OmcA/MtrC family decaheme c-type cytochrome [Deltaproteobacteria bacterium]
MRATAIPCSRVLRTCRGAVLVALLAALACRGPEGQPGPAGPQGDTPDAGAAAAPAPIIDYGILTSGELQIAKISAELVSVLVPADGRPVVTLKVTERHGSGVRGMSPTAVAWRFGLVKLTEGVNGAGNDSWVSYMAKDDHSTATLEKPDPAGFTDLADGTYEYRFTQVVTAGPRAAGTAYEPSKVHRVIILLSATGNPFSPVNVIKDFIPSTGEDVTGKNEKVDVGDGITRPGACLECHTQFRATTDSTGELGTGQFHGGVRFDIRSCAGCHNNQMRFAATETSPDFPAVAADQTWKGDLTVINNEAVLNLPVFIHKLHMGENLKLTGGTYRGFQKPYEITYPQDVRNCVKCHRSPAPLADNWKNEPSRRACGACHDDISFVSPAPNGRRLHTGGPVNSDAICLLCHSAGAPAGDIASSHIPISPPNPGNIYAQPATGSSNTNAAYVAAVGAVPAGAQVITYQVNSVSTWTDTAVTPNVLRPQIVFKFQIADPTATPPVAAKDVVFDSTRKPELGIPGFVGSPSAYFVYSVPQDGVTAPADFNVSASGYIRNIWNGSATGSSVGKIAGPDAKGFYTVQLTGVVVPANAVMLTGGIGYTYSLGSVAKNFSDHNQPLTQINLLSYPYTPNASGFAGQGGLVVPAPDVWKVATGFTGRRIVVDNSKCSSCHVTLGVGPDFHAGQRNDSSSCNFCHRPNQSSSGWAANQKDFIHAIHGSEKRTVPFNWHAKSATDGYYKVTYPAVLNKCEMCHLPGTYDFSTPAAQAALPNMLFSTVGQGRFNGSAITNPAGYFSLSPYVDSSNATDYGFGFATSSVNASLPDGISGTQGATICTPASPCICNAANPCSVDVSAPYTVNNVPVAFSQKIGAVTTACAAGTTCACTTAQPCTGTVATCSVAAPCQAQGTTLVKSPIAAACSACHDTPVAIDHMQTNGASFYEPRSVAFSKPQKEECMICHGPNRIAAISLVHSDRTP